MKVTGHKTCSVDRLPHHEQSAQNARRMDKPLLRLASSNAFAASRPRTPPPDRRLVLIVSHSLPPDALDREWEDAERLYPHFRPSIVQLKHAIRERGIWPQSRSVE
jgi:hypothetical protein